MPNDPVQVYLKPPVGSDGWMMKVENGGWTAGPQYPHIDIPYKHNPDIVFTIQNGVGQDIKFAADPFLVPPKSNVFGQPSVSDYTFTVTDHNQHKDHIPYVLVFDGAPKLDPIIDNDGGGHLAFNDYFANKDITSVGIGGLVLGVILTLVARAMFRNRGRVER